MFSLVYVSYILFRVKNMARYVKFWTAQNDRIIWVIYSLRFFKLTTGNWNFSGLFSGRTLASTCKHSGRKFMANQEQSEENKRQEVSVLTSPHWIAVFLAIAVPTSLVPFLIGFMLGLSVGRDFVFGLYALLSGAFSDYIIRWRFGRVLVVFRRPRIPFIILWILLCLYVMLFAPFE